MSIFKDTIDLESNLTSRVKVLEEKVEKLEKMLKVTEPKVVQEEEPEYCCIS